MLHSGDKYLQLQIFVASICCGEGKIEDQQVGRRCQKMDRHPQRQDKSAGVLDGEFIVITSAGDTVAVARSQVRWVDVKGDYVRLHTAKHSYLWRQSLTSLEEAWGGHGFARIHRCRLVFIPLVTKLWRNYSGWLVRLGSGPDAVDLPVSRRKVQTFKQRWTQKTSL